MKLKLQTPIRIVLIDEEALARERLVDFLSREEDMQVVGICANGIDGLRYIEEYRPALIFLEAQMSNHMSTLDGFRVLEILRTRQFGRSPLAIFTSTCDQYALRAFEANAVDYLLKPFSYTRFQNSLARARMLMETNLSKKANGSPVSHANHIHPITPGADRLVFKSGGRIIFVKVRDIRWIGAEGNYLRIHTPNGSHLLRETMTKMEERLNPELFLRVHRSTIVNISYVKELQPWFNRESNVVLEDGTKLPFSRGYKSRIDTLVTQ